MIPTRTEWKFMLLIWTRREEWFNFNNQKIYKTYSAYAKAVRRLQKINYIKRMDGKITLNNIDKPKLNDFCEVLEWILKN